MSLSRNDSELNNNKHETLKFCIRKTLTSWKALNSVFVDSSDLQPSENEVVDWMAGEIFAVLKNADITDVKSPEDLLFWLNGMVMHKCHQLIPDPDDSSRTVSEKLFFLFRKFYSVRKYAQPHPLSVSAPISIQNPNINESRLISGSGSGRSGPLIIDDNYDSSVETLEEDDDDTENEDNNELDIFRLDPDAKAPDAAPAPAPSTDTDTATDDE